MIRLVVDNTRSSSSSPFLVFAAARGMPSHAARSVVETLRDLSIDLARRGSAEAQIRSELLQSADFMIRELFSNFFSAGELAQMVRFLGLEVDRLLALALPLRARPQQPTDKPAPVADPVPGDVIDVDYEEVPDVDGGNDNSPAAVLFAIAA